MSTTAEHIDDAGHAEEDHAHGGVAHTGHTVGYYVSIALILAAITGLEVTITYVDIGAAFMPLLLILMGIKFVMVVLFFMHLWKDAKIFHYLFWTGFGLAVAVYIGFLATFKFFLKP